MSALGHKRTYIWAAEAAQSELESAKQEGEQAKAQVAELEQKAASLNSELQKADGQRIDLQRIG